MDYVILFQQIFIGLVNGLGYALFAVGLTLIFGVMKIINMAHGEVFMFGAFVAYTLSTTLGLNFYLASLVSIILVSFLGIVINRCAVQPLIIKSSDHIFLSTIAVSLILLHLAVSFWSTHPRTFNMPFSGRLEIGGIYLSYERLAICAVAIIILTFVHLILMKTWPGKAVRASSQNLLGAYLVGINVKRVYDYTLILASALAAMAGILLSPILFVSTYMGQNVLIMGFAIIITAGMGNVIGSALVGILFGLISSIFGQYVDTYYSVAIIYLILVIVLLVKPSGLFVKGD